MVTFAEWLDDLRRLHEKARAGALEGDALLGYLAARDQLLHGLLVAQQITREFGHPARQSVRIAWALQVDLGGPTAWTRAVTLDVSAGGFAALLGSSPEVGGELEFSLRIPQASPLRGKVRVVAAIDQQGNHRVSFAFSELSAVDRERLESVLFDRIVASVAPGGTLPPAATPA